MHREVPGSFGGQRLVEGRIIAQGRSSKGRVDFFGVNESSPVKALVSYAVHEVVAPSSDDADEFLERDRSRQETERPHGETSA